MKTEKKRTLKGSVLFTVVSVLALMIVFLTSALALASAANRRAHKSYSSSQASYTARAAIDSILAAVGTDNEFADAVDSVVETGSIKVDVGINEASLGKIDNCVISYAGTTNIFDPDTMKWVQKNVLEISAEVTLGKETQRIVSHIIQDPVTKSEDGPGYLTMGGKSYMSNNGSIMGGTYIGMGMGPEVTDGNGNKTNAGWQEISGTFYNYDNEVVELGLPIPRDEYMTIPSDKRYWTNLPYNFQNQNRLEAPVTINGNFSVDTQTAIYYTQAGKGMTVWGDFSCKNGSVYGSCTDNLKSAKKLTEAPFLYIDGKMTFQNQSGPELGSTSKEIPYNIFAGSIQFKDHNGVGVNANVYLMDEGVTSKINRNGSHFSTWVSSSYTGSEAWASYHGNWYSLGSIDLADGKSVIDGQVRTAENLIISEDAEIGGDVVVGGTLDIKKDNVVFKGKVYAANVTGNGVTADTSDPAHPTWTYKGKTIEHISRFYEANSESIYPEGARREVLTGMTGPIKGTEGRVVKDPAPPECDPAHPLKDDATDLIQNSCTLTGVWTKNVKVQTSGSDIHVNLKDVSFQSNIVKGNTSSAFARITVDDSKGGKVYFHFEGLIESDYEAQITNLKANDPTNPLLVEANKQKLIDNVFTVMDTWDIESNIQEPENQASYAVYTGKESSCSAYTVNGKDLTIKQNTTLKGVMFDGGSVTIEAPDAGQLWVVLDDVKTQNNVKIIIDDTDANGNQKKGEVNLYIAHSGKTNAANDGDVQLNNTKIITQSFLDAFNSGKTYQIVSDPNDASLYTKDNKGNDYPMLPAPNVNIFSDKDTHLKANNDFFITAFIRTLGLKITAPTITQEYDSFLNRIYYDGVLVGNATSQGSKGGNKPQRFGMLGCLNVHDFAAQNDWILLYVKKTDGSNGTVTGANNKHIYASVDYIDY